MSIFWRVLAICAVLLLTGAFYWSQVRPQQIKKECAIERYTAYQYSEAHCEQISMEATREEVEKCRASTSRVFDAKCSLIEFAYKQGSAILDPVCTEEASKNPVGEFEAERPASKADYRACLFENGLLFVE